MKTVVIFGECFTCSNDSLHLIIISNIYDVDLRFENSVLEIFLQSKGWYKVDAIVWRFASQNNFYLEYQLLQFIKFSGVKCINNPYTLLTFSNKLTTYKLLKDNHFLVNPIDLYIGKFSKQWIQPREIPSVIKIGDYHCGYGKFLVKYREVLNDINDFSVLLNDYVSSERFINYKRDIRCLIIGSSIIFIEKRSANWKANVNTEYINLIEPIDSLQKKSFDIKKILGADVLGVDWLQDENDNWIVLEVNLIPDLHCASEENELDNKAKILDLI